MYKAYTGVGSRNTPEHIMAIMNELASKLESSGWTLRSGAAQGADTAFENGVINHNNKEVYIAWNGFSNRYENEGGVYCLKGKIDEQAKEIASSIHPAWDRLSYGAKGLHSRNCFQVLGKNLDNPSKFLVCYAETDKQGIPKGGTRTAWVLAREHDIPCFNLFVQEDLNRIIKFIN